MNRELAWMVWRLGLRMARVDDSRNCNITAAIER